MVYGNYIRPLSDVHLPSHLMTCGFRNERIQQLHTTANLPNMQRVVGMPDLHPGTRLSDWRSVLLCWSFLSGTGLECTPAAVWRYGKQKILARKYNADKFEKRLSDLDDVAEESWLEENLPSAFAQHPWRSSLGSIGGGNHFAELQQVDQIINAVVVCMGRSGCTTSATVGSIAARGGQFILQRHIAWFLHLMVCLKEAHGCATGILRNMTMRWRLRVLIAR